MDVRAICSSPSSTAKASTSSRVTTKSSGNNLIERFRVRFWTSAADFGAPSAASHTIANVATEMYEYLANADYDAISDANGVVTFDLGDVDVATWYVMAEVDGRIYSFGVAFT